MIRVRFTLDYSDHLYAQATAAIDADREAILAYGSIVSESQQENGAKRIYTVEYEDSDGWEARGQAEETSAQIGLHATMERISGDEPAPEDPGA